MPDRFPFMGSSEFSNPSSPYYHEDPEEKEQERIQRIKDLADYLASDLSSYQRWFNERYTEALEANLEEIQDVLDEYEDDLREVIGDYDYEEILPYIQEVVANLLPETIIPEGKIKKDYDTIYNLIV